ncbi:MarR family transcriptional regulator [Hoyosella rhizosphaerae]|uniref:Uncharacterized protein n=1 Tax=Hoyosella rhizosphaerae TaxID=1755582 RepID=A0A916U0X5_9ACTN|nr:MarR family transcriptional regulator [Hoyosella rhizosphaerae]MBN4927004.1 MarR family transcriptional regulator [Hoyosella rhizosphaerae]GGC54802.1 hypothetical protein GCM10011410_03980 [Hoyosella rhizosphaerae]
MTTHYAYSPELHPTEYLDEMTVGDGRLVKRIAERIRLAARSGTRAHTLITGARGTGKTHTLAVAVGRASASRTVANKVSVVWLGDGALETNSYTDFLVNAITQIDPLVASDIVLRRADYNAAALEEMLTTALNGRVLVLVIESLDAVFDRIGIAGTRALRGFVETHSDTLVLASAPTLFPAVSSRTQPWFGNFDIERTRQLTVRECTELLRRRGNDTALAAYLDGAESRDAIDVVYQALGGAARVWHLIADTATPETLSDPAETINKALDMLTPSYHAILSELPNVERAVIVTLGRGNGDAHAFTVGELAAHSGITANTAAVTLRRLTEHNWVVGAKRPGADQRRTYYHLTDPLLETYIRRQTPHRAASTSRGNDEQLPHSFRNQKPTVTGR